MNTRDRLKRIMEEAAREIDVIDRALDRFGEDVYEVGAALSFEKAFERGGKPYEYIVLKAPNGRWYPTGKRRSDMTWSQLVEFLGEGPCPVETLWLVSSYQAVTL